jgi:hypothetical protein
MMSWSCTTHSLGIYLIINFALLLTSSDHGVLQVFAGMVSNNCISFKTRTLGLVPSHHCTTVRWKDEILTILYEHNSFHLLFTLACYSPKCFIDYGKSRKLCKIGRIQPTYCTFVTKRSVFPVNCCITFQHRQEKYSFKLYSTSFWVLT